MGYWTRTVAVAIAGLLLSSAGAMGQTSLITSKGQVLIVDLSTPEVSTVVPGATEPHRAIISGNRRTAYTVIRPGLEGQDGWVEMIDLKSQGVTVLRPQAGLGFTTDIAITRDGKTAYIPSLSKGILVPLDLVTSSFGQPVTGLDGATNVAIAPDGRRAYVTAPTQGLVYVVDLTQGSIAQTLHLAGAEDIAVTPDGSAVFVSTVTVKPTVVTRIDAVTWAMVSAVLPGGNPNIEANLAVSPDGRDVYAANESYITRLRTDTGAIVASARVDLQDPGFGLERSMTLVAAPDNQFLYADFSSVLLKISRDLIYAPIASRYILPQIVAAEPAYRDDVVFMGDSVTAGFGYCGGADTGVISGNNCGVNAPFADDWGNPLTYSLSYCAPGDIPSDRCSNNNYQKGAMPWDAPSWTAGANAPTVAYSYVIAEAQAPLRGARVFNWAMTGSTPADWSPGDAPGPLLRGRYADQLDRIYNSYVVMTLGANPILNDYIDVTVLRWKKGPCASTVLLTRNRVEYAATLSDTASPASGPGVGVCFQAQWAANQQSAHLKAIYQRLLDNGNRVVVVGYPPVCPWTFGTWQPAPNIAIGPSKGKPCDSAGNTRPSADPASRQTINQAQQAFYLDTLANGLISNVVTSLNNPNITFVAPNSADWQAHQNWNNLSYVFSNDTWVHPSILGHQDIASQVEDSICGKFKHWCRSDGQLAWWSAVGGAIVTPATLAIKPPLLPGVQKTRPRHPAKAMRHASRRAASLSKSKAR